MAAVSVAIPKPEHQQETVASNLDSNSDANATVAEVAIPLQTLAAISAAVGPETGFTLPTPEEAKLLIEPAFEAAVAAVAHFQDSYHAVTRDAVTLLTRELLPPIVPYTVRDYSAIQQEGTGEIMLFLANMNISQLAKAPELVAEKAQAVISACGQHQALRAYLDLHRQGAVALRRGNTRESVVMFATASEALFNIILCHMRWEEGFTPEESANDWQEGLVSRIKTQYPRRLGGDWNLQGRGPVGRWAEDVAAVRHRVVHGGYLPSRAEAEKSMRTVEKLLGFIGDRLVYGRNLRSYPRTASQLLNEDGLRRRGRYPNWIRQLQVNQDEPIWHERFGEWYSTHIRILSDASAQRTPNEVHVELLCTYTSQTEYSWAIRDPATAMAAEARVSGPGFLDDLRTHLPLIERLVTEKTQTYPVTIGYELREGVEFSRTGPWVEQYHLCPLIGVMVDKSDLSAPWPISASRLAPVPAP